MTTTQKRCVFVCMFLVLLGIEICIALFVHDNLVRPYIGDVLAVGVVYCMVKILFVKRTPWLPLYVFLFSAMVELLPFIEWVRTIGESNRILGIIIGSVFDWKDIVCYAVGCLIIAVISWLAEGTRRVG